MPANENPRVVDLLSWHGHAGGGVHVPFQVRGNPLGQVIETPLVRRLRVLATDIAADAAFHPRWVFLVGGPGNGKSETVQDFLVRLDAALGLNGVLSRVLMERFSCPSLVPRKVEILPADLGTEGSKFAAKVGRLVVVQDATATDTALGNAANELAHDLADLLTCPETSPGPVFMACANRGLLARAMNEAFREFGGHNEVTRLLANIIEASSLGKETLAGPKSCWPLQSDNRFACWPLDVESLLVHEDALGTLEHMLLRAVDANDWETAGRCQDCTSREYCPFRQNAEWLRDGETRKNLLAVLRHGELARGQRWNFRDAFSLIAELVIGQWSDFEDSMHPCRWVHQRTADANPLQPNVQSVLALSMQLYPHAMFKGSHVEQAAKAFQENQKNWTVDPQAQPLTLRVLKALAASGHGGSTKPIHKRLARDYSCLDPAITTPSNSLHVLRSIEDAFCQSVEQGRTAARQPAPSRAEDLLLDILDRAEREWDLLGTKSATAIAAVCLLRKLAGMMAKRSVGIRLGHHALDNFLADYEACLRDGPRLEIVRNALQPLLGDNAFRFNLLEILGQPTVESQSLVSLQGQAPGVRVLPAPMATTSAPGHDVPCIEVTDPNYRIPLTFDFYMALRLRKDGCAGSSLPASVRAALDRVQHRYAGELCRREDRFVDGRTSIALGASNRISVSGPGASPGLVQG